MLVFLIIAAMGIFACGVIAGMIIVATIFKMELDRHQIIDFVRVPSDWESRN